MTRLIVHSQDWESSGGCFPDLRGGAWHNALAAIGQCLSDLERI